MILPHYSILYSLPYVALVMVLFFIYGVESRYKLKNGVNAVYLIVGFVLLIFIGLRGHIQTDFIEYYPFFNNLKDFLDGGSSDYSIGFEPGFVLYSSLIKAAFPNYFVWIFINTLIDVIILNWFFKKYSYSGVLSWIFFILFSGLVCEFNLYRNIKAIVVFLISLQYIEQRRFWPFFLLWGIEMTMHISSMLYFPMYWLLNIKYNRKLLIGIFLTVNVIFFAKIHLTTLFISVIDGFLSEDDRILVKAVGYLEKGEETGLSLGYLEKTTLYILCMFFYHQLIKQKRSNLLFCNSFFIYYILWYIFSDVKVFVERFPILFVYSYWIICPNIINLFKGQTKAIIISIVFLFSIMKTISLTNQRPYLYENLLGGISSYEFRVGLIYSWRQK